MKCLFPIPYFLLLCKAEYEVGVKRCVKDAEPELPQIEALHIFHAKQKTQMY